MDQGQAPAVLLKCHHLRLMFLYPAQFQLPVKEESAGEEALNRLWLLSWNKTWVILLHFVVDTAG